jgi:pyruvate dehydrogenase E2 component (dihydrolipoamide acetyltransferase)
MAVEVIMPKVDMVMETGTFIEWLKEEGAYVEKGEPLFVISTDKASMEIEAPASGYLNNLRANPSDEIPVTTVIAYIGETIVSSALTKKLVSLHSSETVKIPVYTAEPAIASILQDNQAPIPEQASKSRATPVARRLAKELGINLQEVKGNGFKGRIHKADVQMAAQQTGQKSLDTTSQSLLSGPILNKSSELIVPLPDARRRQVIPLGGARKIIAQRMQYSASAAPHISLTLSVDMSEASNWRNKVNSYIENKTGYRLSYTAIIARSVAFALTRHPLLNSSIVENAIILWEDVHLGIAMDVDGNVFVPVIREAQTKKLEQIVATLSDLLDRARSKKLLPSEISGSTFTISNLGMFGIETFSAIINPPEAGILAVGKIEERQIMTSNGPAFRPMMALTLSADHRIIDGVAAARFLEECKNILENPYLLI